MKNIPYLIFLSLVLCSCSLTYELTPKQWLYVTKIDTTIITGDTLTRIIRKKHLIKRKFFQQDKRETIVKGDTSIYIREKWCALGRVSPNTRQLIKKIDKRYCNGKLYYRKKEWLSLLLYDSHFKWIKLEIRNGKKIKSKWKDNLKDEDIIDEIK